MPSRILALGSVLAAALFAMANAAEQAPSSERNFVACPIVLDTKDIPCWVTEYQGERYFLTPQTGRSAGVTFAPQLKHKMLVEGTAHPERPRICGGIVLEPVKLSVFPDVDLSCNDLRGDEGYTIKGPRPIGPDGDPPGAKTTAVRRPIDPSQTRGARAAATRADAEAGKPRSFEILYFFDSNYLPFPVEQATVDEAADYFAAATNARVTITGYRGKAILTDGAPLVESAGLPEARARKVAAILKDFGVPTTAMKIEWKDEPEHNGGVLDWRKRRVVVDVVPGKN